MDSPIIFNAIYEHGRLNGPTSYENVLEYVIRDFSSGASFKDVKLLRLWFLKITNDIKSIVILVTRLKMWDGGRTISWKYFQEK